MLPLDAQPNAAHLKLAELEQAGRLSAVITQNIDGLHQKAGSRTVLELHGSIWRNHCMRCGKFYPPQAIAEDTRPGSPVYLRRMDQARRGPLRGRTGGGRACRGRGLPSPGGHADRGLNQPDGIPRRWPGAVFPGENLVLINRDATPMDSLARLVIREKVGEVLARIQVHPLPDTSDASQ